MLLMSFIQETHRRRTFAIISHPDAGKTTLTEKLLLYGGALQLAGSVRARKAERATASDWMELERKRGISVSSTVLQFDYRDLRLNLLDTPGHKDFSEDTYRVLTAVDSVIMVIDSAKGIEAQTRKLYEVCRRRHIPIFTFMNKCDRPTMDPIELLDQLESILQIKTYAVNWPMGTGVDFKGVYDRMEKKVHLFERAVRGAYQAPVSIGQFEDPYIQERMDPISYKRAVEELAMIEGAGASFNQKEILSGHLTPVYFGSAMNNFGVQLLLDGFADYSPAPAPRTSSIGVIQPEDEAFSGFIFKIQGNMDPKHRDRITFLRVVSGKFTRGMEVILSRTGQTFRINNAHKLFGQDREIIEEAYPGDIIGLIGYADLTMGDTLTTKSGLIYHEIPRFPPEVFAFLNNPNPSKFKPFRKGVEQLLSEWVVQSYQLKNGNMEGPLLAAVGPLQFEVVQYRLQSEYGAESELRPANWKLLRWVDPSIDPKKLDSLMLPNGCRLATDSLQQPVILFTSDWAMEYFQKEHPEIGLHQLPPSMVTLK